MRSEDVKLGAYVYGTDDTTPWIVKSFEADTRIVTLERQGSLGWVNHWVTTADRLELTAGGSETHG